MIHLRSIDFKHPIPKDDFPFNLPVILYWNAITFPNPVTFFVGENGSGKSTILKAIACAVGSITTGSESVQQILLRKQSGLLPRK